MAIYSEDQILGFWFDNELVCWDCATDQERESPSQDQLVLQNVVENSDDYYFCDRCDNQLG